MARWSKLARWRGPTPNRRGRMVEHRGLVVHIAEGFYEGSIAWIRNDRSDVSAHFVGGREADERAQLVDTADMSWTQGAGNPRWLSVEFAGFTRGHKLWRPDWHELSDAQLDFCTDLLVKAHQAYRVPLQLAHNASGRGLGYHAMGGPSWGHQACPGAAIRRQLPLIVTEARRRAGKPSPTPTNKDWTDRVIMALPTLRRGDRGPDVARSMGLLAAAGFAPANSFDAHHRPDGVAGSGWEAACRSFQSRRGLPSDGVVGPRTWRELLGE